MKKISTACTLLLCSITLSAQLACSAQTFQPGEIVSVNYIGEIVDVKVLKQDSMGVMVLLKDWQDGTFKPDGQTRYYQPSQLTRKVAGPANAGGAVAGAGGGFGGAQAWQAGATAAQANPGPAGAAQLGGTGPLSKQQILDYLRANLGSNKPNPRQESVNAAVVEAIKKRGVNFKKQISDMPEIFAVGGDMTVIYAINDNYGPPTQMPWLFGPWELQFTNATGFFASKDSAAKMGFVSIEPGHTYLWKIHQDDPPTQWIDGKWREATAQEMKYQGGAGIVLLNGEQNMDFIVFKDHTSTLPGDWVNVTDLETRGVTRGGVRKR